MLIEAFQSLRCLWTAKRIYDLEQQLYSTAMDYKIAQIRGEPIRRILGLERRRDRMVRRLHRHDIDYEQYFIILDIAEQNAIEEEWEPRLYK